MAVAAKRLTDEQAQLFLNANYGVVADVREDGSPHQTVVWVDWDGENVVFNTAEGRAKPRFIRRDPRVSVLVLDPENPFRWVAVSGPAEIATEGAVEHIDKLAKKYMGRDEYGVAEDETRLIVRVRPERVDAAGFD